jgi:2,3,4,5-tetrahydropyridine-2-carboxylate N-succinyltransferase
MDQGALQKAIDGAWERRDGVNNQTRGEVREAVDATLELLDDGKLRVAETDAAGAWKVNQWAKKAVLLSFRLTDNAVIQGEIGRASCRERVS